MATVLKDTNATDCSLLVAHGLTDACHSPLKPNTLVSDESRILFQWVVYAVLLAIISSFGVTANIINIICFVRQGLKDPVTVSLLGLSISDFGILVTCVFLSIGNDPAFFMLDLPVDIADLLYISCSSPYVIFTGVSSWLTAVITLERCFCVTNPLKVKSLITPRRITIIVICVFIFLTITVSPMYYVNELAWTFSPERNRTILQLIYKDNRDIVEQITVALNNVFIPFSAYLTIITGTVILVVKLREKAKWRMTRAAPSNVDSTSERDHKVSKMVIVVSTLFIICYSPICVLFIVLFLVPELAFDGPNQNLLIIFAGLCTLPQSANSSANIFIYYRMSSRYRTIFQNLFHRNTEKITAKD